MFKKFLYVVSVISTLTLAAPSFGSTIVEKPQADQVPEIEEEPDIEWCDNVRSVVEQYLYHSQVIEKEELIKMANDNLSESEKSWLDYDALYSDDRYSQPYNKYDECKKIIDSGGKLP